MRYSLSPEARGDLIDIKQTAAGSGSESKMGDQMKSPPADSRMTTIRVGQAKPPVAVVGPSAIQISSPNCCSIGAQ